MGGIGRVAKTQIKLKFDHVQAAQPLSDAYAIPPHVSLRWCPQVPHLHGLLIEHEAHHLSPRCERRTNQRQGHARTRVVPESRQAQPTCASV